MPIAMNEQQILEALEQSDDFTMTSFHNRLKDMQQFQPAFYKLMMEQMVARNLKDANELKEYLEGNIC